MTRRRLPVRPLALAAGVVAAGGAAAALAASRRPAGGPATLADFERHPELGWNTLNAPTHDKVETPDGAHLAIWDIGSGPPVVLPHCWGCSHAVWIPVARRLLDHGHRVVLYDQRGHGQTTRGTAPLSIELLARDLELVLETADVRNAVLAGHSMGGMTIMSLATHRPDTLMERGKGLVLVATAASSPRPTPARAADAAAAFIGSSLVTNAMHAPYGRRFVRGVFGAGPIEDHMDLTRHLFGACDPDVRGGFLRAMAVMDLVEGIARIDLPTTVVVGALDRLTPPRQSDRMVSTIPGARLVTLADRGHMLPLEDPAAVTAEIVRMAQH
ncbi:MAG TPA: alpha/beta fold hydrolase [Acidimicrobiales bacterium]|nr:alpha/beta fold hydrolase [Acidimicrobiales bacterium]